MNHHITQMPQGFELLRSEVAAKLNPHLLRLVQLYPKHVITWRSASELLTSNRLDILAKAIFAEAYINNWSTRWADFVYHEHLRTLNPTFVEGDGSGKTGFNAYRTSFISTIQSVKSNGIDPARSIIPITPRGTVIDGSHRVAAAFAFNCPVPTVTLDHPDHEMGCDAYTRSGLQQVILEELVRRYVQARPDVFIAFLFPALGSFHNRALNLLTSRTTLLYKKQFALSELAKWRLLDLVYHGEHWRGHKLSSPTITPDILHRFGSARSIDILFLETQAGTHESESPAGLFRNLKGTIRDWINNGNYPIHITDTHREAAYLANHLLGPHAATVLHSMPPKTEWQYTTLRNNYTRWIQHYDTNHFCIDTGGTLASLGLRDTSDIDFLTTSPIALTVTPEGCSNHHAASVFHDYSVSEIVHDPRRHFYSFGLKHAAPSVVIAMKSNRGEPKDAADIDLLKSTDSGRQRYCVIPTRPRSLAFYNDRARGAVFSVVRCLLPCRLRPFLRSMVRRLRQIATFSLSQGRSDLATQLIYYGFRIYFPAGTSLISRVKQGMVYEPLVTRAIRKLLPDRPNPVMLDIGSNIGLLSLNVLFTHPDTKIYAFEPRTEIAECFLRTLIDNYLSDSVSLTQCALGNFDGSITFYAHGLADASGDGIGDTGRAGSASQRIVPIRKLDSWWSESGSPRIDLIKIDVEGAEYHVLQGANDLLRKWHPAIVFEVEPMNIASYDHCFSDLFSILTQYGYEIRDLHWKPIPVTECPQYAFPDKTAIAIHSHDPRLKLANIEATIS